MPQAPHRQRFFPMFQPSLVGVLLAAALAGPALGQEPQELVLGHPIEGRLDADLAGPRDEPPLVWDFLTPEDGTYTLGLESYDFNGLLSVCAADGRLIAEDERSGIEQNAWLMVELERGALYRVGVASKTELSGAFVLRIDAGDVPLPSGQYALEITAEFYRSYAERNLVRAERDLARREKHLNDAAQFMTAAGNIERDNRRYERARVDLERAVEIARDNASADQVAFANCLLGSVLCEVGEWSEALDRLEAHVDDVARLSPQLELLVLEHLGRTHAALGDLAAGEEWIGVMMKRAIELVDPVAEGYGWICLGAMRASAGQPEGARDALERAIEFADAHHVGVVAFDARLDLAELGELRIGYGEAEELLLEASELALNDEQRAQVSIGLGNTHFQGGRFASARSAYAGALRAARRAYGRTYEADALFGLATVWSRLDRQLRARELLEELVDSDVRMTAETHAAVLIELVRALRRLGAVDAARERLQQARAQCDGDEACLGNVALAAGMLSWSTGDTEGARGSWTEALNRGASEGLVELEATAHNMLSAVYLDEGHAERAREAALRAVHMSRATGRVELTIDALASWARAALATGDTAGAEDALEEGRALVERPSVRALGTADASAIRARSWEWGEIAQDIAARNVGSAEDKTAHKAALDRGFAQAALWKGRALLEGIVEHRRSRSSEVDELRLRRRSLLADLSDTERALALERLEGDEQETISELRARVVELVSGVDEIEGSLRNLSSRDANVDVATGVLPASLQREVLREGDLLIDYAAGSERLFAYALTPRGATLVDLGDRASIESDVWTFERTIARHSDADLRQIVALGAQLHEQLLAPALALADGAVERLIVIPNASLAGLPFEALVAGDTAHVETFADVPFVLAQHVLTYAPSSGVLLELAGIAPRTNEGALLVLADPIYAVPSGAPSARRVDSDSPLAELPRLPGTRLEALALARGMGEASEMEIGFERSYSLATPRIELHLGAGATSERLRTDPRRFSILHLAAHGVIDAADPGSSGIVLSRNGLDVDFLSASDVLELDLDLELAVLSACQTANGRVRRGEGVQSLARAFLYAGSRGVVASLWQVGDREATATMIGFYREMRERGRPPAEALREAKLALARGGDEADQLALVVRELRGRFINARAVRTEAGFGHPWSWAPFVYVGQLR